MSYTGGGRRGDSSVNDFVALLACTAVNKRRCGGTGWAGIISPACHEQGAVMKKVTIWDVPTRLFHWSLPVLFGLLWFSGEQGGDWLVWHMRFGMLLLTLLLFRLAWGLFGSQTARFAEFIASPAAAARYLREGKAERYGHNPLGGWMVVAMLLALLLQIVLGLFAADVDSYLYDGPLKAWIDSDLAEQVSSWHGLWFNALLGLVVLHLLAIVLYAVLRRQNLVRPMLHGKADDQGLPVPKIQPVWLAVPWLLLAVALVYAGIPWLAAMAPSAY